MASRSPEGHKISPIMQFHNTNEFFGHHPPYLHSGDPGHDACTGLAETIQLLAHLCELVTQVKHRAETQGKKRSSCSMAYASPISIHPRSLHHLAWYKFWLPVKAHKVWCCSRSSCWHLSLVYCTDDDVVDLLQRGYKASTNQAFVGLEVTPCNQHAL